MGPRGLGPNPFSTVSPCPPGFFFSKNSVPKTQNTYLLKNDVFFRANTIGNTIGKTIGNSIGNSIGNTIGKTIGNTIENILK